MTKLKEIMSMTELRKIKLNVEDKRNKAKEDGEFMLVQWLNEDLNAIDKRMSELK